MSRKIIPFLFVFTVTASTLTFAHGDGHEKKNNATLKIEEASDLNDSIYVVNREKNTEPSITSDDPLGLSILNTDILSDKNPLTGLGIGPGEPMIRFEEKIDSKQKHSQHEEQKQHVEKATHEWVSISAKGYGVAVGITVISGLAFAALSFSRIGRRNAKNLS